MSATNTPSTVFGQEQELTLMEMDRPTWLNEHQPRLIVNVGTAGHHSVVDALRAMQDFNVAITLAATAIAQSCLTEFDCFKPLEFPTEVHRTNGPKSIGSKRKRNPDRWR